MDVEPFPRMKLMKLYYIILQELNELPEAYTYKFLSQETTRYRMKIVDENMSVRVIEEKVGCGLVEELIFQAHNEIKLLRIMKRWRPWEIMARAPADQVEMDNEEFANLIGGNPFPAEFDRFDDMKHTPNTRAEKYNRE